MKRPLGVLSMAGLLLLMTVAAQGRLPNLASGSDGYHHLLMLDQREALEHLKALHHYVQTQNATLDPAIIGMHLDEIGRNLDGMKAELAKVEATSAGTSASPQLANVRLSHERLDVLYENLKALAQSASPRPEGLRSVSVEAYQYLRSASMEHDRVMSKLGVREPIGP